MSGTTPPQAKQVSLALKSLSSNVSRDEKERANSFLESFQKSVSFLHSGPQQSTTLSFDTNSNVLQADSWSAVLGILDQGSTAGDDVKIFAAQTLRSKVSFLLQYTFPNDAIDKV